MWDETVSKGPSNVREVRRDISEGEAATLACLGVYLS